MPLTFVEIGSCHFWVARWCDWEGYIGKYEFRSCHACNTSRMSSVCKKCFDEHQCLQLGPPNTWLIVHRLNRMSKCEMVLADRLCTTPGNGCNFHSNLLGSLRHFPSSRPSSPCRYNACVFFFRYTKYLLTLQHNLCLHYGVSILNPSDHGKTVVCDD